jgi:hypothetical protein
MNSEHDLKIAKRIIASLILLIVIGVIYLFSPIRNKSVTTFNNFQLPRYGEYNNEIAKYLILLPLKAVADPNNKTYDRNQTLGYGLLGTSLLNTGDEYPSLGYRSFFLGGSDIVGLYGASSKLEATFLNQGNIFLINTDLSIVPTDSIIRKREAVIYGTAFGLTDRYTYRLSTHELVNESENYHITGSNVQLKKLLISGNEVFDDLKRKGYEDITLKYTLGILNASLKNDGIDTMSINEYDFGTPQIFTDALKSTLSKYPSELVLKENIFIKTLARELGDRGLNMLEQAFFRKNSSSDTAITTDETSTLIKIISDDLNKISK